MVKTWVEAVTELRSLGYVFSTQNDGLKFDFKGNRYPDSKRVTELLTILKDHKQEMLNDPSFLIEAMLTEIGEGWSAGVIEWVKRFHPEKLKELATIEGEINGMVSEGDIEKLREALTGYRKHFEAMVELFKTEKDNSGNLF